MCLAIPVRITEILAEHRALAAVGAKVIVPVRDPAKAAAALAEVTGDVTSAALDLGNLASVRAFIAQRLVRRLCVECRIPGEYHEEFLRSVGFPVREAHRIYSVRPGGCDACGHAGYRGRTAVYELFRITEKVQDLVVSGASKQDLQRQGMLDGYVNMREYGWRKVMEGHTTIEEVVSSTELT